MPVSWIATWGTWVETNTASNALAFHAAGGKFAVAYTDPNYFIVSPTATDPGNYPESAFGHGSNGGRSQRPEGGGTEYYLLPNSPGSQSGFQGIAQNIAGGGGFDYLYADGVSDSLSESLYRIAPIPVEITTDAQYVDGMQQLLALSPLPMIINGYNNGDPLREEQEYVGAPNIAGVLGEECFTSLTFAVQDQRWLSMADALLATTASGHLAVCGGRGALADNRPFRTYYLASWWLTYDPAYSVSFEDFSSPGGVLLFPEQLIVPTQPLQNAGADIGALQVAGGAYVRQFGACYYSTLPWGACAAFVNPSSSATVGMPAAATNYHHALSLDNNNLYNGGQASLSTSIPTSLGPGTAVILFQ